MAILFLFLILLYSTSVRSQMHVTIELPEETNGEAYVDILKPDTLEKIYFSKFYGRDVRIDLMHHDAFFSEGTMLRFEVNLANNMTYVITLPACMDSLSYNVTSGAIIFPSDHPLYTLTRLSTSKTLTPKEEAGVIDEIQRLYTEKVYPEYVHYLIYNAVQNGLLPVEEVGKIFDLDIGVHTVWLDALRLLSDDNTALKSDLDQMISRYSKDYEFILLKFWATWCAPCMRDDKTLSKLDRAQYVKPGIIGIQLDKVEKETWYLENIIDRAGELKTQYGVSPIPHYVLMKNGVDILVSNRLDEVLEVLKK